MTYAHGGSDTVFRLSDLDLRRPGIFPLDLPMASNNIVFRDSYGFRKQIPVTILDDDIRNTQCLIGDIACRITIRNPSCSEMFSSQHLTLS